MIHRISPVHDELVLLLFYLVQLLLVEPQIEIRYMKYETKMIFSVFFLVSSFFASGCLDTKTQLKVTLIWFSK